MKLFDQASSFVYRKDLSRLKGIIEDSPKLLNETDVNNFTLLDDAITNDFEEGALFLIEKGSALDNVSQKGEHTIHLAIEMGLFEVVKRMLAADSSIINVRNKHGNNPIWTALMEARHQPDKYLPLVELLLKNGADVNNVNNYGKTPLFILEIATDDVKKKFYELDKRHPFIE